MNYLETFRSNIGQIGFIYLFILIGCLLIFTKLVSGKAIRHVSSLLGNFFLPCTLISSVSSQLSAEKIVSYASQVVTGALVIAVLWFPIRLLSKRMSGGDYAAAGILTYVMLFPNINYFGMPIAEKILPEMFLPIVFFGLPFMLTANTLGLSLLSKKRDSFSLLRLIPPPAAGVIIGLILGFTQIHLPAVVSDVIVSASGCTTPMAMLLTGMVFAESLKDIRKTMITKAVLAVCIRMFAAPLCVTAAVFAVCRLMGAGDMLWYVTLACSCLPCGMNLIFLAEKEGINSAVGTICVLLSNAVGIITIPLVFSYIASVM